MWKFTGSDRPEFAIEPGPGQESVWDYPRPPICVEDPREVRVCLGDLVIAQTTAAIRVLETASPPTFYLPAGDVNLKLLRRGNGSSFCEWKGAATYWSLENDGTVIANVGWSYPNPTAAFANIAGHLSFYPAHLECYVDGQRVRPQDGGFYGGWVTDEIIGPWKGQSGTGGW